MTIINIENKKITILGLGVVCVDIIASLEEYPKPDQKVAADSVETFSGGKICVCIDLNSCMVICYKCIHIYVHMCTYIDMIYMLYIHIVYYMLFMYVYIVFIVNFTFTTNCFCHHIIHYLIISLLPPLLLLLLLLLLGNVGNTLSAISKLNKINTKILTKIGNDPNGKFILKDLKNDHIDVFDVLTTDVSPTLLVYIIIDKLANRTCIASPGSAQLSCGDVYEKIYRTNTSGNTRNNTRNNISNNSIDNGVGNGACTDNGVDDSSRRNDYRNDKKNHNDYSNKDNNTNDSKDVDNSSMSEENSILSDIQVIYLV